MALFLHQLVQDYLPAKRRQTPKGWWNFDAVCCHHRGHNHDSRFRGNLLVLPDGSMIYNCYNCGFKTGYKGGDLSHNFENWLRYLGIPQDKIQVAKLEILGKKLNGDLETSSSPDLFKIENFPEVSLPLHADTIENWLKGDDLSDDLIECIEYISNRGRAIANGWQYYWTPSTKKDFNKRIIIPFYHNGKTVGWTGRYAGTPPKNIPRYFNSDVPTGYIFNNRVINIPNRKYVMITEGPFDAIAVDGVSPLGSTLNKQQISWLASCDKEKIIVPDRQLKNQDLIDAAITYGWSVSFPEWEDDVKDAADASIKYGKLYTISSIIRSKTTSNLEIGLKRQLFRG